MNAVSQILGALIEAWGEVKVQKARVVLSLVGVVAAVAAMTIVIALGDLLLQSSRELAELYEGRSVTLRLTPESSSNASEWPATGGQPVKRPDEKDTLGEAMGTLAERTDIHYWSRFSSGGGDIVETRQARSSGQFRGYPLTNIADMVDGVTFQGVDPSYEVIFRTRMLAGRWVVSSDADQRLVPVVISETLWNQLGRAPIDQVPIVLHTSDGTAMRVVGITKSKSSYDMPTVFAHYDAARVSFPQMSSPSMIAWVGTENADQARENLPRALASILGEGWKVSISGGEHEDIGEEQLGTISNVIMVIGGIIVFLGALGLLNVAIVTVRQRVREIGIRRAVGASAARVFFAVFMESVVATFVAGVIGVGIAVVVVRFLPLEALNITLSDTPAFPAGAAIAGVAISTSIGALCGIIPAFAAVRIKPIDAIRY
ncbi:ABC transporter permease [Actinomyces sp. oral taxon 181]|uniref:ABC transporter permease n=1 Tax=Actinomyces sp. oral taxon 181 TaxID=712121 RepID=UPI0002A22CC1|nr:ABC transporter permease [Actinomyces sp. oral taxon 181]EKY15517.1 efflux ABC transporter, permease protein [Actinomyces sp. oral taxon 181 str. F0379]